MPDLVFQVGHAPSVRQASAVSIACTVGKIGGSRGETRGGSRPRRGTLAGACERGLKYEHARARLLRLGNPTYMRLRRANSTAGAPVKGISQCVV